MVRHSRARVVDGTDPHAGTWWWRRVGREPPQVSIRHEVPESCRGRRLFGSPKGHQDGSLHCPSCNALLLARIKSLALRYAELRTKRLHERLLKSAHPNVVAPLANGLGQYDVNHIRRTPYECGACNGHDINHGRHATPNGARDDVLVGECLLTEAEHAPALIGRAEPDSHRLPLEEHAEDERDGPTQESQPAVGEPVEIPISTREEVFRDLGTIAKPRKRSGPERQED